MACSSTLIESRHAWCRLQRKEAIIKEEVERYLAEEEGLVDVMLGRNCLERHGQEHRFAEKTMK